MSIPRQLKTEAERLFAEIKEVAGDLESRSIREPWAQASSAILGGSILTHEHNIKRLQEDVAALADLLAEIEK